MTEILPQAVTGVVPPQGSEARVREVWPSVAGSPAIAGIGLLLTRTIVLAPLGWLIMSLVYFGKLLPFVACRYTLTNRRLMVRRGWAGTVSEEVPLEKIDEVRVVADANSEFFRAANVEVVSGGSVALTLAGVPDAECFRHAILNTRNAWVPDRSKSLPFIPASAVN